MSNISDIYDSLYTITSATFSSALELTDLNTEENSTQRLRNGFMVTNGPASNVGDLQQVSRRYSRAFNIVLTRATYDLQGKSDSRKEQEKQLMEDQLTLFRAFKSNFELQNKILTLEYNSDAGIETVISDKEKFISITTEFIIDYYETL